MPEPALLYAYRDQEAIRQYLEKRESGSFLEYEDMPPTYWASYHYTNLWSALAYVPERKREEMGIVGVVTCITADEVFFDNFDGSIEGWHHLDGLPESFERLMSLIEGDPCALEIPLRRAIASCVLRPRPMFAEAQDEAWPRVAGARSEYAETFREELRELVTTLRALQAEGETHIQMTVG